MHNDLRSIIIINLKKKLSYLLEVTIPVTRRLLISTRDNRVLKKRRKKKEKKKKKKKRKKKRGSYARDSMDLQ